MILRTAVLLLLLSCSLAAETRTSGTLTLASGNPWRGLELNAGSPTVAGRLDYRGAGGWHLAALGSSVEFRGGPGLDPQVELQVEAGRSRSWGRFELDLGLVTSRYPGAVGLDYDEAYLRVARRRSALFVSYSPNYFGTPSWSRHVLVSHEVPLGANLRADLQVAAFRFQSQAVSGLADYNYWILGIGASAAGTDFRLQYSDTNPDSVGFPTASWSLLVTRPFD